MCLRLLNYSKCLEKHNKSLIFSLPVTPAGCVRNTLHLSPLCQSLPAQRAGIPGGVWRWCPTWRTCTATRRRTMTSSTMERMRSYTLRTSQCQVGRQFLHKMDLIVFFFHYCAIWEQSVLNVLSCFSPLFFLFDFEKMRNRLSSHC